MQTAQGRYGLGRHIDPAVGFLKGEGAQQRVETERDHPQRTPVPAWNELPTRRAGTTPDYYGRPAVKEPVWIWSVPLYFQVGGIAGAAAVLAAALQSRQRQDLAGLRRTCRWIGAGGAALGGALLTYDLGRPERFLHMLRMVRPTSPMSLGSWTLAKAGGALALALLAETNGYPGAPRPGGRACRRPAGHSTGRLHRCPPRQHRRPRLAAVAPLSCPPCSSPRVLPASAICWSLCR